MAAGTGFDWAKWLPLIIGGVGTGAGVVGGIKQANAAGRAVEYNAQAAKDALALMGGMFALEYGNKAPYRALGTAAIPQFAAMSGLKGFTPPLTPDQGAPMSPSLAAIFKSANIPLASFGGGGLGGAMALQPDFSDISTKGINSRLGQMAGRAVGGAGLGATAGSIVPGVGTAIGAAGGALYGGLSGLFDNNNADKNFASTGINRVSDWTWNTLMPAVKSGQISPQDAENAFNDVWGKWESSMKQVPNFNQDVYNRSVATQRQYFNPFFEEINRLKQPASTTPTGA